MGGRDGWDSILRSLASEVGSSEIEGGPEGWLQGTGLAFGGCTCLGPSTLQFTAHAQHQESPRLLFLSTSCYVHLLCSFQIYLPLTGLCSWIYVTLCFLKPLHVFVCVAQALPTSSRSSLWSGLVPYVCHVCASSHQCLSSACLSGFVLDRYGGPCLSLYQRWLLSC